MDPDENNLLHWTGERPTAHTNGRRREALTKADRLRIHRGPEAIAFQRSARSFPPDRSRPPLSSTFRSHRRQVPRRSHLPPRVPFQGGFQRPDLERVLISAFERSLPRSNSTPKSTIRTSPPTAPCVLACSRPKHGNRARSSSMVREAGSSVAAMAHVCASAVMRAIVNLLLEPNRA